VQLETGSRGGLSLVVERGEVDVFEEGGHVEEDIRGDFHFVGVDVAVGGRGKHCVCR
jgi:hypothetical protein